MYTALLCFISISVLNYIFTPWLFGQFNECFQAFISILLLVLLESMLNMRAAFYNRHEPFEA